jgi:hypothetical protein
LNAQRVAPGRGRPPLFIGRVLACSDTMLPPLVFQAGHYRQLGELL